MVTDDPEFAGKVNCPVDSPPVAKLAHTATFVTSLSELFVTSRLRKKGDGGGPTFVACEIDVEIRNAASAVAMPLHNAQEASNLPHLVNPRTIGQINVAAETRQLAEPLVQQTGTARPRAGDFPFGP